MERRLPWGANQGRLRNYAINVIEKMEKLYKNQIEEAELDDQKHEEKRYYEEQNRREKLGLNHLNDLSED